jgi:hypothetical protein
MVEDSVVVVVVVDDGDDPLYHSIGMILFNIIFDEYLLLLEFPWKMCREKLPIFGTDLELSQQHELDRKKLM